MPESDKLLRGFDLIKGRKIGPYTILEATATHEVIKQYREYLYRIIVITTYDQKQYQEFYDNLLRLISERKTIYGARNPYICVIDLPRYEDIVINDDDNLEITLIGHSYRSR